MKPRVKIKERIAKAKEKVNGTPLPNKNPNSSYEGSYGVVKLKVWNRYGKNPVEYSAIKIKYLQNKTVFSKNLKTNLLELDSLIKETIKIAKEKDIKIITFNTWIFFEHPEIEAYFKKKYNLELFADHTLDAPSLFEKKFENKRIKGIDFRKRTIVYIDSKGRLQENHFAFIEMPEYAFKIKD